MTTDPFAVLGVPYDATAQDVKRAYRRKAMETHPDRHPGDPGAEERFKAVGAAWEALSSADGLARARARFGSPSSSGSNGQHRQRSGSTHRPGHTDPAGAWTRVRDLPYWTADRIPDGSCPFALYINGRRVTPQWWILPLSHGGDMVEGPTPEEVLAVRPDFRPGKTKTR